KQFFGTGLCKTADDLGAQGEWPVHAELLVWLAVEFRDSGWDVKHIVRTIVLSRTYRQAASGKPTETDPDNRLLARQSRFRRDAGGDTPARIAWAWRQALQRPPRADEVDTIAALVEKHRREYADDPAAAASLLAVGFTPVPRDVDAAELAAWTNAARVILNLH